MQRIFITGVGGLIGSHAAKHLVEKGFEVHGCDNFSGGIEENVPPEVHFSAFDMCDGERLKNAMRGCDVVIHCAALAYDGLSVFSPAQLAHNIVYGTTQVTSSAIACGVRRLINFSSMARYGDQRCPFHEALAPQPTTPYGLFKVAAEDVVQNLAHFHGLEYVTCVPHNVVGPGQRFDDPFRNVVALMINMMLQNRQPFIYGSGEQVRCFSHVRDVISVMDQLLSRPDLDRQVINLGPDEESVSINDLAKRIAQHLNFDLRPQYIPSRPGEVLEATCSSKKARQLLGYRTSASLDTIIQDTIVWVKQVGPRPFRYNIPIEIRGPNLPITWQESLF